MLLVLVERSAHYAVSTLQSGSQPLGSGLFASHRGAQRWTTVNDGSLCSCASECVSVFWPWPIQLHAFEENCLAHRNDMTMRIIKCMKQRLLLYVRFVVVLCVHCVCVPSLWQMARGQHTTTMVDGWKVNAAGHIGKGNLSRMRFLAGPTAWKKVICKEGVSLCINASFAWHIAKCGWITMIIWKHIYRDGRIHMWFFVVHRARILGKTLFVWLLSALRGNMRLSENY